MPDDPPGRLRHAEPGRSEGDFGCPPPHPPGCKATNVEPSGCASGKNIEIWFWPKIGFKILSFQTYVYKKG